MKARGWATTDVGRKREHNEDSYLCNGEIGLFAVADGMGGHLGGERASRMAVEILEQEIVPQVERLRRPNGPRAEGPHPAAVAMKEATRRAAAAIYSEAQQQPERMGMGTTLTAIFFHGDQVSICHVGDSRAYLYRDGQARQLTEDHSWIQEQIRAGLLKPEDALVSRFRNIITRSVGFEPGVEPDLQTLPVEAGDCFLLCSDGLSNYLSEEEIGQVLTTQFYGEASPVLVDLANERGGDDNITCLVVYVANED
jgi:serine/threonine protein phosphatase PrpC